MSDIVVSVSYSQKGTSEPDVPQVYVLDPDCREWIIELYDGKNLLSRNIVPGNEWFHGNVWWYVPWVVRVRDVETNAIVFEDKLNLKFKTVAIRIASDAIGDNIAWFPYIEEFRKKHRCKIICQTNLAWMFHEEYPEITFVPMNTDVRNVYAFYQLGTSFDKDSTKYPSTFITDPMQKCAADILGVEHKEIKPKIYRSLKRRPIVDKYVCISPFSNHASKQWNEPGGWQSVVDLLRKKGYTVAVISKEKCFLKNVIDLTGDHPLKDRVNQLEFCEFFVGSSSGLSWLAWAVGKHVFLISDVTPPWSEFQSGVTRFFSGEREYVDFAPIKKPTSKLEVLTAIEEYVGDGVKTPELPELKDETRGLPQFPEKEFKMMILMPAYERKQATKIACQSIMKYKAPEDKLVVFNDHSMQYTNEWLSKYCDEAIELPQKENITTVRFQQILYFYQQKEYNFAYFVDNDTIHDPGFRKRLKDLYYLKIDNQKRPVCLYNSIFHAENTKQILTKNKAFLRTSAPGCSLFFDRNMIAKIIFRLRQVAGNKEINRTWDYIAIDLLEKMVITSDMSYVEHLGMEGMHNKNFERDRAVNPSPYLKKVRYHAIYQIVKQTMLNPAKLKRRKKLTSFR